MGMVKSYLSDWWHSTTRGAPLWLEFPSVLLGWGFDLIPNMPQFVPYTFYAIFFLTVIFFVPYRLYVLSKEEADELRKEIDDLNIKHDQKINRQTVIDVLAEHRSEGISILNKSPSKHGGLTLWIKEWQEWRDNVIADLDKHFSKAESLSFQRLGVLSDPAPPGEDNRHQHKLVMLAKQLRVLENLIDRYQERV